MRRRFSRRGRRPAGDGRGARIDAGHWLQRINEERIVATRSLEPLDGEQGGVPASFAAVGTGESEDGTALVVAFAPESGGDALLAAIAVAERLSEESGFAGEAVVVAPEWSIAARRRLALVRERPYRVRAVVASALGDGDARVEPEAVDDTVAVPLALVAAHLAQAGSRELFQRATSALEGLASKHSGAVRAIGRSVELVVMARRVAVLRADDDGIVLDTILPQRSTAALTAETLSGLLDGLEGQLRRRLNDRRAREGEDGMRARLIPLLCEVQSLRSVVPWPVGGADRDALDLVGVDPAGRPVVGAARELLDMPELGSILDATQRARSALPMLLSGADAPVRLDAPGLLLAARGFEPSAARVLPALAIAHDLYEVRMGRARGFELASLSSGEAVRMTRERVQPEAAAGPSDDGTQSESGASSERGDRSRGRGRGRGRSRRSRGGRGERSEDSRSSRSSSSSASGDPAGGGQAPDAGAEGQREGRRGRARWDEVSAFDLDDEPSDTEAGDHNGQRRRRGRSRRGRSRRGSGGDGDGADADAGSESAPARAPRASRPSRTNSPSEDDDDADTDLTLDDDDLISEILTPLPAEVPDEIEGDATPAYDDDDESDEDDEAIEAAAEKLASERSPTPDEVAEEKPKPRRRVAIVAHADRDSILGAVLLARDLRLVEGIWVYPQSELMTFFRGPATDLRDKTPIHVIGFTPSPAFQVLQAAALYRDRLTWYDHHVWPPEDAEGLRNVVGEDALHLTPGTGTALPALLATFTRRSRFSDKLADLASGRFTHHDYERWGRLWWWRIAELASRQGEVKSDLEPLLAGRPSDLAKEAMRAGTPPLPPELGYVSEHDFRVVHFGGYTLVVVAVAPELDPHLTARIARARHGAQLSLAVAEGEELVILSGEELAGRRSLDFGAVVEHLSAKLDWVDALSDDDRVARIHVRGLRERPDRLDEVIGEIAMGRSILER